MNFVEEHKQRAAQFGGAVPQRTSARRQSLLREYLRCIVDVAILAPLLVSAQWPFDVRTTPDAQWNALNEVQSQVKWLHNAAQTAPNFGAQGYGNIRQQFDGLRAAYSGLKGTLTPRQLTYGADDLAELDSGLDILQDAFSNYEQDLADGRPPGPALNQLCQVLRQGSDLWLQELKRKAARSTRTPAWPCVQAFCRAP